MHINTYQRAFTLIETIIYLALFTIIIGGGMVATYQIIESSSDTYHHLELQEEANFLLAKIDWALVGATSVNANGSALVISKFINGISTQLLFATNENNLTLQINSAAPEILNASSIGVANVSFTRNAGANGQPDCITTSFDLITIGQENNASENFSFTKNILP